MSERLLGREGENNFRAPAFNICFTFSGTIWYTAEWASVTRRENAQGSAGGSGSWWPVEIDKIILRNIDRASGPPWKQWTELQSNTYLDTLQEFRSYDPFLTRVVKAPTRKAWIAVLLGNRGRCRATLGPDSFTTELLVYGVFWKASGGGTNKEGKPVRVPTLTVAVGGGSEHLPAQLDDGVRVRNDRELHYRPKQGDRFQDIEWSPFDDV